MDIGHITFQHEINIKDYNELRGSVDFIRITPKRAECALANSLFKIVAVDGETPVGMARVVEEGETVMVNLMSAMNKESFYKKLGFHQRPFGNHGSGMSKWISRQEEKGDG